MRSVQRSWKSRCRFGLGILVSLLPRPPASVGQGPSANTGVASTSISNPDPAARARVAASYGKLPLSFEKNNGQTNQQVKLLSRGRGYTLIPHKQ
jgi:hypothetical protein